MSNYYGGSPRKRVGFSMKDLIVFLAKQIVTKPDEVIVTEAGEVDGAEVFNLQVAEEDKGFIIGKHGRVAKAIRQIARSAAAKQGKKIVIDII